MSKLTYENFDRKINDAFLRQAMNLAEEEQPKQEIQEEPKQETPEEPKQEDQPESQEELKTIEDIVKDNQVTLLEKFDAVKSFKPGKSEAINFRNAVQELIKAANASVEAVNAYYNKALGGTTANKKILK